jgi:outer membrane protein
MKHMRFLLVLATIVFAGSLSAQKAPKFGHINSAELLSLMPERKAAAEKMDSIAKQAEKHLQEMMMEYRAEQEKLSTNGPKMSELVRKDAEEKLNGLATRIQNFQQQAQESLQEDENKLIEPIVNKAKKAIEQVAKENGYTYILDTSGGAVLYWEESDNILGMVKKKLGLP